MVLTRGRPGAQAGPGCHAEILHGQRSADAAGRVRKAEPDVRAIPVIMLTACGQERDIPSGLQGGAADYIAKPFSLKELLARVDVALRRR